MPPAAPRIGPLWWLLLALSLLATIGFVFAVSQRLPYPHELEWMEGALADHAARVADGRPLYCEPGPEHVPFLYAPLLFWLGALGIELGLDGILALRLIALAFSLATAAMIGHWVRRETGRVVPGLVAIGLFLAGYGWLAWWYDLARNDSLFVFFCAATAYQLRHGASPRWLWAGLLAVLAVLAKQSAMMWLPAIAVGAICWNWRIGLRFSIALGCWTVATVALLHATTDGWSTFYLFEMPRHHGWVGDRKLGFWTEDMLPLLPLLLLGVAGFVDGVQRDRGGWLYLAAFGCGGLACSWLSRMHVGGFDNVLMYGFVAAVVLGVIAACSETKWLRITGPIVLLAQFGALGYQAWQRDPAVTLLPTQAHRDAHRQLRALVAEQDGPVWIPGHGHIAYRAGKGTGAHGQAIFDLLQLLPKLPDGMLDLAKLDAPESIEGLSERGRRALAALRASVRTALAERHFAAIVVDDVGAGMFPVLFAAGLVGPDGRFGTPDDPYVRLPGHAVDQPAALRPLLGYDVHSPYVLARRN